MTKSYTARELAERIGATLQGDPALRLSGVAALEQAGPGDVAFFADRTFALRLRDSGAGAVIVAKPEEDLDMVQFVAPDPHLALRGAILAFHRLVPELVPGVASTAVVDAAAEVDLTAEVGHHAVVAAGAKIGAGSCVSAGCYVGPDTVIGRECYIYPRVTIYGGVTVGDRVILHSGVVLGADGFGYAKSEEGALKVPQIGGVLIEDDVEIGANTTVDRATLGQTKVGKGTKIDNLVMVAHNVEIGRHCLIVSQTGIAGSSRLGDGVITAGQVGIADHLDIGSGAILAAQSGVGSNVPAGKIYLGTPARDHGQQKRIFAYLTKLPDWARRLRELESKMAGLSLETQPADEENS